MKSAVKLHIKKLCLQGIENNVGLHSREVFLTENPSALSISGGDFIE